MGHEINKVCISFQFSAFLLFFARMFWVLFIRKKRNGPNDVSSCVRLFVVINDVATVQPWDCFIGDVSVSHQNPRRS